MATLRCDSGAGTAFNPCKRKEKNLIEYNAEKCGLSVSEYLRQRAIHVYMIRPGNMIYLLKKLFFAEEYPYIMCNFTLYK